MKDLRILVKSGEYVSYVYQLNDVNGQPIDIQGKHLELEILVSSRYMDLPVGSVNVTSQSPDLPTGEVVLDFPWSNLPAGMQVGVYKVRLVLEGTVVATGQMRVLESDSHITDCIPEPKKNKVWDIGECLNCGKPVPVEEPEGDVFVFTSKPYPLDRITDGFTARPVRVTDLEYRSQYIDRGISDTITNYELSAIKAMTRDATFGINKIVETVQVIPGLVKSATTVKEPVSIYAEDSVGLGFEAISATTV